MNNQTISKFPREITPNFPFDLRHRIYDRLIYYLEDRRVKFTKQSESLQFILNVRTKRALDKIHNVPAVVIDQLEKRIMRDAEKMLDVEVTRASPSALFYALKSKDEAEDKTHLIIKNRIVGVPDFVLNALVCEKLEKDFSRRDILSVNGFVLREDVIRLDVDERLVRRGFMMPIFDKKNSLITALRVYRYPKDERPFVIRSRQNFYPEVNN